MHIVSFSKPGLDNYLDVKSISHFLINREVTENLYVFLKPI